MNYHVNDKAGDHEDNESFYVKCRYHGLFIAFFLLDLNQRLVDGSCFPPEVTLFRRAELSGSSATENIYDVSNKNHRNLVS
jgi:hypothetical protein